MGSEIVIVGVLQARCTSRRLPGKVMAPILGQPMILRQVERLQRSKYLEHLVIATSTDHTDDALAKICASANLKCHRGSLEDVLDRVLTAAGNAEHVVRLTADCPLVDPEIVDRVIMAHLEGGHDYTSNAIERTFPDGLDVEVVRYAALARASNEATLPSEREHVTPFFYSHPEQFQLGSVISDTDHGNLRWTVDEEVDLDFVREVYAELYPSNPMFATKEIMNLLDRRPELKGLNNHIPINEGYPRSISEDPK